MLKFAQTLLVIVVLLSHILLCNSSSCSSYSTESTCESNSACSWTYRSSSYSCSCASETPQDIYFVLDASGSVGDSGWSNETNFVSSMISSGVGNTSRVGLITFASGAWGKYNLTQTQHPRSILTAAVKALTYTKGSTYTKTAVSSAISMFKKYATKGYDRLLLLITDGIPNPSISQSPCGLKSTLDSQNITVVIVGVGSGFSSAKVDCLVDDTSTQIISVSNFTTFDLVRDYTDSFLCPTTVQLTLTEVRVQTDSTSTCQFIEFYNSGSSLINLKTNPLKLSGYVSGTLNSSIRANISVGQYVVLYKSTGASPNCYQCTCSLNSYATNRCANALYIPCDGKNCTFNSLYKSKSVNNTNWGVVIQDGSDNSVLANISYSKSTWPSIYSGYTFELQSLLIDDALGTNWAQSCWNYGTPGQGPLSTCTSCQASVCQANGDSGAKCSGSACNCTESNKYYYSGSSCYLVPNATSCSTLVTKDSTGTYVSITWNDVTITDTHYFQVQYPYDSGTTGMATTASNEHFYLYYDTTVTTSSTTPIVRTVVPDNTSTLVLDGSRVVYGDWITCPISTQSPTKAPTQAPTYGIPSISGCNATVSGYNAVTIKWTQPTFSYPTTPSSVSSYKIYITCNDANTTYYSSSRVFYNIITGCSITSGSSLSSISVAPVVDDGDGNENDSLMRQNSKSCTIITPSPTAVPSNPPTKQPTFRPTSPPTNIPTPSPTYEYWKVTSCSVAIQQGSSGTVSISYTEHIPSDTSNSRTISLYDRNTGSSTSLSSNPSTVIVTSPSITDTNRFVVYPTFALYPGGPSIGATCCNATCTVSTFAPTPSPTSTPTKFPTNAPTHLPSTFPTALPTSAPTPSPTYAEMSVANCSYVLASGFTTMNVSFDEPDNFTFPISQAKYRISWNYDVDVTFIAASTPGASVLVPILSSHTIDPSADVYVTVYYETIRKQGDSTYCYGHTQPPTPAPTTPAPTPYPTWSQPSISFDSSQFSGSCSYTSGSFAACTITPSAIARSLTVVRSPSQWGYDISANWQIVTSDRRRMLNSSGFGSPTSGSTLISKTPTSGDNFNSFDYIFEGTSDNSSTILVFTIELTSCEVSDSTYDSSIGTYDCVVTDPSQVVVTVEFPQGRLEQDNQTGSLPMWIWYAIGAALLVVPLLSFFGYRHYKSKKMAELLKEVKEDELKQTENLDDAANFGGLGDEVTFNPLATGGTHDIATGGQYIDTQLEAQKQQFEVAHVDVDTISFKQDFGQVQAGKH